MKQWFVNLWLSFLSEWRRWRDYPPGEGMDLSGYRLVEVLNGRNTYKGFEWAPAEAPYHPRERWQWFDNDCVTFNGGKFYLHLNDKPRTFGNVTCPWAKGVVQSKRTYKYGYFEATITIPMKAGWWFALWLTGEETWPPELDIVEGYSRNDSYKKLRKFQSNLHWLVNRVRKVIRSKDHPVPTRRKKVMFAAEWTESKVRWYVDGYLVRVEGRKYVTSKLNEPMRFVLNSGCQNQFQVEPGVVIMEGVKVYTKN